MTDRALVTGIRGFIAKWIALELLRTGYAVRGTLRDPSHAEIVRATLSETAVDPELMSFAVADLTQDNGWREAAEGCQVVFHVASPFPIRQPSRRDALVPIARAGTLRVLEAARLAGVNRLVMTSSMVAMMYRADRRGEFTVTESDWTDPGWPDASPYIISKTRAEEAAWTWAEEHGWTDRLVAVNPGFVLGPLMDPRTSTSTEVVRLMLTGAYPALPPVSYPVVDVRDVARLHRLAAETTGLGGRRLIAASETLALRQMAGILREQYPERASSIRTRQLPAVAVRLLARFDPSIRTVLPDLGAVPQPDTSYVTDLTGLSFRPGSEALVSAAQSLIDCGLA